MKDIITLSIESSCDETAVAVLKNGREVLANVVSTQIELHKKFGGVVPEVASRKHIENIDAVYQEALDTAGIKPEEIDHIAVTYGPGLVGALLVGLSYAKALAFTLGVPLVGVNHMQGHINANYIQHKDLKPPFITLVVSGGHTHLVEVKDYQNYEILGRTRDDASGEAFDKISRAMGLGYPGGPKIDKLAQQGKPNINLPKTHFDNLNFSFSGIKTAVINLNHNKPGINKADLAVSFEKTVAEILVNHIEEAVKITNINKIVLAGGVSANTYIRKSFDDFAIEKNLNIYYPELKLCTDNGAMIASAGYYEFIGGNTSNLELNAIPNLTLS